VPDALTRWRDRCCRAIATGEGLGEHLRWPNHVKRGIQAALDEAGNACRPAFVLQIVSVAYGRLDVTWDRRRDDSWKGWLRALAWLREEIEREAPRG